MSRLIWWPSVDRTTLQQADAGSGFPLEVVKEKSASL